MKFDKRFGSIILLGLCFFFVFTAFQTQGNIQVTEIIETKIKYRKLLKHNKTFARVYKNN